MSLTRKMLKAMSIEDDKIDQIIEAHSETVDALKAERDSFKESAEQVEKLTNDLKKANDKLAKQDGDAFKEKYDSLKAEFDTYKKDIAANKLKADKTDAYKKLLSELKVSDKRLDSILKVTDLDSIELDEEGNIKGLEDLKKSLKEEWADFIVDSQQQGANSANPPGNQGPSTFKDMTLAEKMEYANANPNSSEVADWLNNK